MNDLFQEPDHATPLTHEERLDLLPAHIAYRRDLNAAEQANIIRAQDWALSRQRDLLTEKFIKNLHRRMLDEVWRWAGKFRKTERNIGIPFYEIPVALRQLLEDAKAWIEYNTFPPDEIAVRFHHRLVYIHPFPNGNGRHSRLMADLLVMRLGGERFTWGSSSLQSAQGLAAHCHSAQELMGSSGGELESRPVARGLLQNADDVRRSYIKALKAADAHDYALLLLFARS